MPQLEALQRIQVVRVFSIYELLSALQELRDRLSQQVGARLRAPLPSPELQGGQQGLCARQVTPDCLILGALEPLCSSQPLKLLDLLLHVAHGASLQVVSFMGPFKVVLLDSVSAVIYPLLGGRQSEGELCARRLQSSLLVLKSLFHPRVMCLEWGHRCGCDCSQLFLWGWIKGDSAANTPAGCGCARSWQWPVAIQGRH